MPKRLLAFLTNESTPAKIMDMRQGLDPIETPGVFPAYRMNGASAFAISPDQSYAIHGSQAPSNNMNVYGDPANLADITSPAVSFSAAVVCVGCSNTHYAFGGGNPFLYVFIKSTGALQTLSTAGLGTLYAIEFSPDGKRMAVTHNTTPFVRIYNTEDWSFVNGGTAAGANCYSAMFSHDGSKLVTFSLSTPFVCVYNPVTGVRTNAITTSNSAISSQLGGAKAVRSPRDSKTILYSLGSSPWVASFDTETNVVTPFVAPSPTISGSGCIWVDPDPAEDAVYVQHAQGLTSPRRTITKFRISDRTAYEAQPTAFALALVGNPTSINGAFAIIWTKSHKITGTVRDVGNSPAARKVRAYRRSDGLLMAETMSDPATGNYTIKVNDEGPYDVQFMTASGELLNDLFYARSEPQVA